MQKFSDIESLRHIATSIKMYCDETGTPLPTIKFRGTVKLHGTNAGVSIGKALIAQGRNRELTIGDDSFGFAHFVASRKSDVWGNLKSLFGVPAIDTLVVFGEWCGAGIQKGIAISNVDKHLVLFAGYHVEADRKISIHDLSYVSPAVWAAINDEGIYSVLQAPTFEIEVNFADLVPISEEIARLTIQVEEQCPWGTFRGVTGIGEGIVWESYDYPVEFQFKSKGLKHKKTGAKEKVQLDPVKTEAIGELVAALLPQWRLEQGIDTLRRDNLAVDISNTGKYLKWICEDILKEEGDQIAANSFSWKEIVGQVSKQAREFYMNYLNVAAGLAPPEPPIADEWLTDAQLDEVRKRVGPITGRLTVVSSILDMFEAKE